ncbi:MAG: YraN family protein [Eubacterium sp.]|nr:YraN family protein [Eubacterium sp.]
MNSLGKLAELKACDHLRNKGYKLVDVNYSSRFGEIDLIMSKGKYLCFIEVKMRNFASIASPAEFVDASKQEKMAKTAALYLQKNPTKLQPRFDVIEVITENSEIKSIKHLENAFELY